MIELSIMNNEASYTADLHPPILELGDWEFRKACIRKFTVNLGLSMRDFLLGTGRDDSHRIYFKQERLDSRETLKVSVEYDQISTSSQNFESVDHVIQHHEKILDTIFDKVVFSPRLQTVAYASHAAVRGGTVSEYIDGFVSSCPAMPGDVRSKGAIFTFDGPMHDSVVQVLTTKSLVVDEGLYLSIHFSFGDKNRTYKGLLGTCKEFAEKHIFPSFGIKISGEESIG